MIKGVILALGVACLPACKAAVVTSKRTFYCATPFGVSVTEEKDTELNTLKGVATIILKQDNTSAEVPLVNCVIVTSPKEE